ncbi:hypothetical protein [Nocardia asteroides]|uniref:hypothetical protein n=1 Tax=Nocardia asteroides TaxID=1824 RepID=UPI001E3E11C7|nr:hypothetical protein [Nocardia asteroides]UGT64650.1 hypothetical protein LTT61_15810 [Nocardia asteroides]
MRAALGAVLALAAVLTGVLAWRNGIRTTEFAPSGDVPAFEATRYAGPWIVLAATLLTVAGLLLVDVVAQLATARNASAAHREQ